MEAVDRRVAARVTATNAVRAQFLGAAFGITFILSMIGDALSMGTLRNHAFMAVQLVSSLLVAGVSRWSTFGGRHAAAVLSVGLVLISTSGAWHLAQFGGLDGPWFYGSYVSAPVLIPILLPLRARAFVTLATVGGFVLVYTLRRPDLFSHPMAHMPVAYLLTIGGISVALGEYVRRLEVASFGDVARLEAAAEFLEARMKLDDARPAQLRKEIARQLHDDVAQLITGARLHLDGWSDRRAKDDVVTRLGDLLDELSRRSRRMLEELREPPPRGPLLEELERLRLDYATMGLVVDLLVDDAARPDALAAAHSDVAVSTIREALTNAIRHGGANEATVNVHGDPVSVVFEVLDNAGGKAAQVKEGNGLRGIREAVEGLGGSFSIGDYQDGLRLTVTLPRSVRS